MRFLVFLIVFAFSSQSFAAQCTQYRATDNLTSVTGEWSASPEAAVSSLLSKLQTIWYGPGSCQGAISYSPSRITASSFSYAATYGGCSGGPSPTSGSGSIASKVGDCGEEVCSTQAGQSKIVNFTVGYTRSQNIDTDPGWKLVGRPNQVAEGGLLCNPASPCELRFNGFSDDDKAWQSLAPTPNGLYRVSLDISATVTGKTCTPTESDNAALSKTAPIPPCPGFTGEVNGVPGCYGTASNPTSNDRPEPKPTTPEAGNPAAGEKPSTGEGSGSGGAGRTPSTGNGGPAGGPAAAAGSGTKPDGTTPKPGEGKEQANCGAPGQPKCGIDESGTPTKFDGKGDLLGGWEEGVKTNRATIEKSGTGIFESFNVFFSAPPLAGCEPIELPNDQVITRHCDVVEGTRSVMAYIWALTALWLWVGWIREAI